jgi:hypothetical protein
MRLGEWVRCERAEPAKGTWHLYAGRVGRIVTINRSAGEYGVAFDAADDRTTWFRADELITVARPRNARAITTANERRQIAADRQSESGQQA